MPQYQLQNANHTLLSQRSFKFRILPMIIRDLNDKRQASKAIMSVTRVGRTKALTCRSPWASFLENTHPTSFNRHVLIEFEGTPGQRMTFNPPRSDLSDEGCIKLGKCLCTCSLISAPTFGQCFSICVSAWLPLALGPLLFPWFA